MCGGTLSLRPDFGLNAFLQNSQNIQDNHCLSFYFSIFQINGFNNLFGSSPDFPTKICVSATSFLGGKKKWWEKKYTKINQTKK